jgi:diguanylate cyclase (GGDEF)-like protein/PAS domain S-box-containing protein
MNTTIYDAVRHNLDYICFAAVILTFAAGLGFVMHRYLVSEKLRGRTVAGKKFSMGFMPYLAWGIICMLLIIGWFAVDDAGKKELERNKMLVDGIAPTFAYELEKMGHEDIRLATSVFDPQYQNINKTLHKWLAINPDISAIYTLRRLSDTSSVYIISPPSDYNHDGQIEGEHETGKELGAPYPYLLPDLTQTSETKSIFREEPIEHEWGSTISAFVPIYGRDGQADAVLGVDFDATVWESKVAKARLSMMAFLLIIFLPLNTTYWVIFHTRVERFRMRLHQEELSESEDRFRKLSNATFEGIVLIDEGKIIEINQTLCSMFGYEEQAEMIGMSAFLLAAPESRELLIENLYSQNSSMLEIVALRKDGTKFAAELVRTSSMYQGREVQVTAIRDISERKRTQEIIDHMALYDALTGLPNRVLFTQHLNDVLEGARAADVKLAVLYLDLDRFKIINDTLGHARGDKLLKSVATRLSRCVGEKGVAARLSGDEFVMLVQQFEDLAEIEALAEKVLHVIEQPYQIDDYELHATASIGIALFPQDGDDAQVLIKNAETALFRVKDKGSNHYSLYAPAMNMKGIERLQLENGLRHALEREEFVLYYQPRINISTGQIIGMEALLRWNHPELGMVPPGAFIPIAEETGLIVPIGDWVLRTAIRQNKAWQDAGYPPMTVAVNLSPRQFMRQGLVELVEKELRETGLNPGDLELEITESLTMHDVEYTIMILEELSKLGVQISIDDFGTGYSSLNYLKHFPISTLKIDQSFVREITIDPYNAAIVTTVIYLAQNLKLKVIAEGVETEEQFAYLREHKCDEMQGFLFSRPVPAEQFEELLKSKTSHSVS